MFKYIAIASVVVLGLSVPAYAGGCPGLSKQVTAGLAKSSLPAAKKAEIAEQQKKGDMQHKTGKHPASVATLKAALKQLGM